MRFLRVLVVAIAILGAGLWAAPKQASAHTGWHPTSYTDCRGGALYVYYVYWFYSASGGYHYGPGYYQWFAAGAC